MSVDITEGIPTDIGGGANGTNTGDSTKWDVLIGGLGFNLRPTTANPYQRATEQSRKQQIDTSAEAGEQSLSSWWTRSQASWHYGAGIRWYEPGTESVTVNRFSDGQGVDPWTIGDLSLLHAMTQVDSQASDIYISSLSTGGVAGYVAAYGSTVEWVPETGTGSSDTLGDSGASQPAAAGGVAWVGHDTGVDKFVASTGTVTSPWTASNPCRAWWVKSRLIVAIGATLYEIAPGSTGVVETNGTVLVTHPDSSWTWTDVTETAGAILASGYADNDSAIFRWTAQNNATTGDPEIVGGSQVLKMPPGEVITCMSVYLGTYCVIGTSSGVRVSVASDDGSVDLGRLTVTAASPTDITFRDRFAYLSVSNALPDGNSGALRIDLSTPIVDDNGNSTDLYPWAWDVSTGATGTATSIALVGDRVALASAQKVFEESDTDYVSSGWFETGRIRFGTVEPKAFRYARVVTDLNSGGLELTAITPDENEYRVVAFDSSYVSSSDVAIQIPGAVNTHQYMSFRVTLTPDSGGTATPVLSGLVVKAQPAATRIRLMSYPLAMFDSEKGRHGTIRGGRKNSAYERLVALETLEETGAPTPVLDTRTGESFTAQIDSVSFSAESPPDGAASGFGGVATVVVRRL